MDFTKHDETPRICFLFINFNPGYSPGKPDVLSDALCCVQEYVISPCKGEIIQSNECCEFNLTLANLKASVNHVTECKIKY